MATTVNMHEAKTQFSKLVQRALQGEEVIVAKAGKALVRLIPVGDEVQGSWIGCLSDRGFSVPEDFNEMGRTEIEAMFYGDPERVTPGGTKHRAKPRA